MTELLSSDRALDDFLRTRSPLKVRLENPDARRWSSAELARHLYDEETERLRRTLHNPKGTTK
jgi:hypothetical protein